MMDRISDNLIRRYFDGELSSEEADDVQRRLESHTDARARLDFERRLKERVGRVMQSGWQTSGTWTTPGTGPGAGEGAGAGLADRVRAALAAAAGDELAEDQIERPRPRHPRQLSFRNAAALLARPKRVNVFAVAACLMLVGGAVLLGIFGRPIDTYSRRSLSMLSQAAEYVSREHGRCAGDENALHDKVKYAKAEDAAEGLTRYLGAQILVPDLTEFGFEFQGGGPCQVPGDDRSGHLMYRKSEWNAVGRLPMVSIFIEPNRSQFFVLDGDKRRDLVVGIAYSFPTDRACKPGMVYTDGPLVYFVTACEERDLKPVTERLIRRESRPVPR